MNYKIAILKNENDEDHISWINAISNYNNIIDYDIIDLTLSNWLDKLQQKKYDIYLTRPPGQTSYFKQLYDERIYILKFVLNKQIYPTYEEIIIYENKKILNYWLGAKKLAHPSTKVFYHKKEAHEFVLSSNYPLVAKTAIGASGSGVKILKNNIEAKAYLDNAFSSKGIKRRWGPNFLKKNYLNRIKSRLKNLNKTFTYYKNKRHAAVIDSQKWFVIFQEYIDIAAEWRCVYIGGNYFAHKKKKCGDLISGGGGIVWDSPSIELLNFMKEIVLKGELLGSSMDILETTDGQFLISEIQSFFGYINPEYQMLVKGIPGKYIFRENNWEFVEGIFNSNNSYDLRISHVLEILQKKNEND